ncbi:ATPase synthesis protein 25, mitochondrial [[Candida] jaroonii]|uniref:ATPase synthesis protein 25, mitochondrial n=1 Tax=[Candida] jaroonii TaxID=467808 RepID=A0ACA9Y509_9ASCO|nr:ATPase synthesis protein 25, mitochondrial [[Candida] jaroonii]
MLSRVGLRGVNRLIPRVVYTLRTINSSAIRRTEDVPWYLRESEKVLEKVERPPIPEIPNNAPPSVEKFLLLLSEEYGLEDIKLFDLAELDDDHPNHISNQPIRYMIVSTGKSDKHVFKAGNELKHYIKHEFKKHSNIEGLVSSTIKPVIRRRMLRRANKGPSATDNIYGRAANSWIMCRTDVDDINIHILTKERREELDLESLWINERKDDLYTKELDSTDTDYMNEVYAGKNMPDFFLQRRGFHTTAREFNITNTYQKLMDSEIGSIEESETTKLMEEFETAFKTIEPTLNDYNLKTQFYGALHLINPKITLDQVSSVIKEKYNDLSVAIEMNENERTSDMMTFMKILSDSDTEPSIKYDLLSSFAQDIYRFSGESIDIPQLIPLLFSLSSTGTNISPSIIDATIYNDFDYYNETFPQTELSGTGMRNTTSFLQNYLQLHNSMFTRPMKETIMFNYGNAGQWDRFWNEWDVSLSLLENEVQLKHWVRLLVYLAIRKDIEGINRLFNNYWDTTTSVSLPFIQSFNIHSQQLTPEEFSHLKLSLAKFVDIPGFSHTDKISQFVNSL